MAAPANSQCFFITFSWQLPVFGQQLEAVINLPLSDRLLGFLRGAFCSLDLIHLGIMDNNPHHAELQPGYLLAHDLHPRLRLSAALLHSQLKSNSYVHLSPNCCERLNLIYSM